MIICFFDSYNVLKVWKNSSWVLSLSYNKLDIINKKNIIIAVFFTEFRSSNVIFVTDRIDQLIGKGSQS